MPSPRPAARRLALSTVAVLALAPAILFATPAQAADLPPVATEAELAAAITTANGTTDSDTITFSADIALTADLPVITEDLVIDGAEFTLDAASNEAFVADGIDLEIGGLTILNGSDPVRGNPGSSVTLDFVVIDGGNRVYFEDSDVRIFDSVVRDMNVETFVNNGTPTLDRSVTIRSSSFNDNASATGLAVTQRNGGVTLDDVDADDNDGDGVVVELGGVAVAVLIDVHATGNGNRGLNLFLDDDSSMNLENSDGDQNGGAGGYVETDGNSRVVSTGGGPTSNSDVGWFLVNLSSTASISFSTVLATQNYAGVAFVVADGSTITLDGSLMQGGVYGLLVDPFAIATSGSVVVTDTDIVDSSENGIWFGGDSDGIDFSYDGGTISGIDSTEEGAGIYADLVDSLFVISNSTITDVTTTDTGAIWVGGDEPSELRIFNTTIAGNTVDDAALFTALTGDVEVSHTTIVGNTMTGGTSSVLFNGFGVSQLRNSIVDGGADALDGSGNITVDYSLVSSVGNGASLAGDGNLTGVSPQLGALADNGGRTLTMLPEPGSPVLDAGDPSMVDPPLTDQRGAARIQNGRVDMGAVEAAALLPATGADTNGMTLAAGALLLLGAAGVAIARRRSRTV